MNDMHMDEVNRKASVLLACGGIAAVMIAKQTYTVKHIQKGLTLLTNTGANQ